MPSADKAKWAQLRVGLMAIVALVILGYLIFLLSGSHGLFKGKSTIYTFMDDSAAISDGAPVTVNGIAVGRIVHVGLSGSRERRRIVKVDMEIENDFMPSIPIDSQAAITAQNLLGTKFINIKKGQSPIAVKNGAELKAKELTTIDDFVEQGNTTLSALQDIVTKAGGIVDQVEAGKGTIGKLLVDETLYNRVLAIADEAQKLTATLNSDKGTIGKLLHDERLYDDVRGSIQDVRGSITRINTMIDSLEQGQGTAGKFLKDPALYDDARKTIGDVRQMLADINAGKGTVGKLLKSEELHNQIQATIGRMDTMLDKINSGQGTIGQLMVNPALYESLDGTTRELQGLLKDFRSNPKKFLHIKIGLF